MVILGFWVLVLFWIGVKAGDLRGDPLTYAVIAKKMALQNQWLNPMMLDKPYLNKPPLFIWITAFFFKIVGVSYYVSKLPALIFSTLDIWMLYAISLRWFKDDDAAFFTAFSFMSTRWVIRDFASSRPESLLVFGLLLGLFAVNLMLEARKSGPYVFGLAVAVMVMTKFAMAFFLLAPTFIFAVSRGKIRDWLRWPHFWGGLLLGAAFPAAWMIYFEGGHPGYFFHMLATQTIERAASGLDVRNSPLLYFKEVLFYYEPWLIFFFIGLGVMWRKRKEAAVWFTLMAVFSIAPVLQASTGKMSRYLIPLTLFLSMIAAQGVVQHARLNRYLQRIVLFLGPALLVFFWIVPVKINPQAYHTVHVAADLQVKGPSFTDTLGFLKRGSADSYAIPLVEWRHRGEPEDYRYTNYFYLPESRRIWDDAQLASYVSSGREKIFLLAPTHFLGAVPVHDRMLWTKICADDTSTLLLGVPEYRDRPDGTDR
jgi:4-amino-4-deoxy-L-arabinose transferase-like glycosyltransferase